MGDPALELVLPEAAVLTELIPGVLSPNRLPELWSGDEITVKRAVEYFSGGRVVQIDRGGYQESLHIPKVDVAVLEKTISSAVESGVLWMVSGPASIFGEPIPTGVLNVDAKLCAPPEAISAAEILPENLVGAWKDGVSSGLSIATALSVKVGKTLPWQTVRDVIGGALQARFLERTEESEPWPCDLSSAQFVKFKVLGDAGAGAKPTGGAQGKGMLSVSEEIEPSHIQDLAEQMPALLDIGAKVGIPIRFNLRIEVGDGKSVPQPEAITKLNEILSAIKKELQLR